MFNVALEEGFAAAGTVKVAQRGFRAWDSKDYSLSFQGGEEGVSRSQAESSREFDWDGYPEAASYFGYYDLVSRQDSQFRSSDG